MITKIDPKVTLAILLSKSTTEVKIGQGILGFLAAIGFAFFHGTSGDYALIYSFASQLTWAFIFAVHGTLKIVSVFAGIHRYIKLGNELLGLWAWTYILLSFTIFDSTPIAPTEILSVFPIMLEFWTLLECPTSNKDGSRR